MCENVRVGPYVATCLAQAPSTHDAIPYVHAAAVWLSWSSWSSQSRARAPNTYTTYSPWPAPRAKVDVTSSPLPKLVPFFVLLSRFVTPDKHFCSSTSARRRKLSSFEDTHGQLSFLMPLKFLPPLVFSLFVNLERERERESLQLIFFVFSFPS